MVEFFIPNSACSFFLFSGGIYCTDRDMANLSGWLSFITLDICEIVILCVIVRPSSKNTGTLSIVLPIISKEFQKAFLNKCSNVLA